MTIDILLTQPLPDAIDAELSARYAVHRLYATDEPDALLARVAPRIRGVVTGGANGLSAALMDRLGALEIVAINGIGTDAVDLERARARGIHVTTTPDVLTDDVADMAMGLILMTLRDLGLGERIVRAGRWGTFAQPLATQVTGKRLGIVGLGRIGEKCARRAAGFDIEIGYHNRAAKQVPYRYFERLDALAQWADFLIVATPGGAGTRHLIDRTVLDALGPHGFLVNVSRGSVVDTAALADALRERRLAGAALDVYEGEPEPPRALTALDNVVLTPHLGGWSPEALDRSVQQFLDNAARHLAGEPLLTPL